MAPATSARTDASSPVSTVIGTTRPPVAASSSRAVASSADAVREATTTVATLRRERPRDGLADALAATGHDRPLASQLEVHAQQAAPREVAATVTPVSERVFERANHRAQSSAHWCTADRRALVAGRQGAPVSERQSEPSESSSERGSVRVERREPSRHVFGVCIAGSVRSDASCRRSSSEGDVRSSSGPVARATSLSSDRVTSDRGIVSLRAIEVRHDTFGCHRSTADAFGVDDAGCTNDRDRAHPGPGDPRLPRQPHRRGRGGVGERGVRAGRGAEWCVDR